MARKATAYTGVVGAASLLLGIGAPVVFQGTPDWVSYSLFGLGAFLLLVAAGMRWLKFGATGDEPSISATTSGDAAHALSVRGNNNTFQFGPPNPAEKQERKNPYGASVRDAPRGCPETPIWQAVEYIAKLIGEDWQSNYSETRRQLRQEASQGRIEIWGRRDIKPTHLSDDRQSAIWTPIQQDYWDEFEMNELVAHEHYANRDHTRHEGGPTFPGTRYWELKVDLAEVERLWPDPNKPKPGRGRIDYGPQGWMAR